MKIILFHPAPLPSLFYGGTERVVTWLAKGLTELGHEVWVAAFAGSRLPPGVNLIPMDPSDSSGLALFKKLPPAVDVIHFMAPPGDEVWNSCPCPPVLTVHGNGKVGEVFPVNSVFLSRDHATRHSAEAFVYNGLDPSEFLFSPDKKSDAYLFLSKTSWSVKNVRGAFRLCRKAGVRLQIAGGDRPYWTRFQSMLSPKVRWVGSVGGETKAKLLAQSRALVFPVQWPEPFGLVVIEALISGTPVLANSLGSIPELVPPDVGRVFSDRIGIESDWIEELQREKSPWKAERCREWAMEKFHYHQMAEAYLAIYRRVRAGDVLNRSQPVASNWRTS